MAVVDLAQETGTITRKERSLGAEAFRRLLKNKIAVLSAIFIIALVFIAIFADFVALSKCHSSPGKNTIFLCTTSVFTIPH